VSPSRGQVTYAHPLLGGAQRIRNAFPLIAEKSGGTVANLGRISQTELFPAPLVAVRRKRAVYVTWGVPPETLDKSRQPAMLDDAGQSCPVRHGPAGSSPQRTVKQVYRPIT
jgi:hypothetical protein